MPSLATWQGRARGEPIRGPRGAPKRARALPGKRAIEMA